MCSIEKKSSLKFLASLLLLLSVNDSSAQPIDLLVYNHGTSRVLRFDGYTGEFLQTFGHAEPRADYQGLALGPDGVLYVASGGVDRMHRFNLASGTYIETFATGGSLDHPSQLLFGPDGYLYVSNRDGDSVSRFDISTDTDLGTFVTPGSGGLDGGNGLAFGADGNLYAGSRYTSNVLRFDGETGEFIDEFVEAGSGGLIEPAGMRFGPDGSLYVVDRTGNRVLIYDGTSGNYIGEVDPTHTSNLNVPSSLDFGPDGNLYVSIGGSNAVKKYDPATGNFIGTFILDSLGILNKPATILFVPSNRNAPPSAPTVAIHPPSPTTVNDLVCTAEGSVDPEGGSVFYSFSWFQDGIQLENESSFSLSHEHTARGQLIECVVTPSDGFVDGPPGSASVIIQNTLPTAPVIQILPENPTPNDGLAVWILEESFDADGDQIIYTFDWFESTDGITWNRRPELSSNLPFSVGQPSISHLYTQVSEHWRVEVTPVEAHTIATLKGGDSESPASGEMGVDEVFIQPDLVLSGNGDESKFDAADLLVIRSVWHKTKGSLDSNSALSDMFFERNAPDHARVEGRGLVYLIVQNWHKEIGN